jgi:hypothetical protein
MPRRTISSQRQVTVPIVMTLDRARYEVGFAELKLM